MMVNIVEKKKTRLEFFALYFISLIFLFVIVAAFWKSPAPIVASAEIQRDEENAFVRIDTFLHAQFKVLDNSFNAVLKDTSSESEELQNTYIILANRFKVVLDSLEQRLIATTAEKNAMIRADLAEFRKLCTQRDVAVEQHSKLLQLLNERKGNVQAADERPTASQEELNVLKQLLVDKDQQIAEQRKQGQLELQEKESLIASYQNQLKRTSAAVNDQGAGNDPQSYNTDLKRKLASLKDDYPKSLLREKALERSYKTIVDDNRRLIVELQKLQKSKN